MRIAFSFPYDPKWAELDSTLKSMGTEPVYCADYATLEEYLRLNRGSIDMVVIDSASIHSESELKLISEINQAYQGVNIIFSSRIMGRGLALAAHKAGASECVLSSNLARHMQACFA